MPRSPLHFLLMIAVGLLVVGCDSPPADRSLVGKTEAAVVAELGKPWTESPGHYGLPPLDWTKQFSGEVKTAKFKKPGGEVYVSFEKRNGIWYVISNDWLPEGAAF